MSSGNREHTSCETINREPIYLLCAPLQDSEQGWRDSNSTTSNACNVYRVQMSVILLSIVHGSSQFGSCIADIRSVCAIDSHKCKIFENCHLIFLHFSKKILLQLKDSHIPKKSTQLKHSSTWHKSTHHKWHR